MSKAGFLLIKGETYPYDVLVFLGVSSDNILEVIEKKYINALTEEEKSFVKDFGKNEKKGFALKLENRAQLLVLRDFPKKTFQKGYLAHEIFHTADLMLRRAGLMLSDDSDEAWAYHIDWLTNKIYTAFKL